MFVLVYALVLIFCVALLHLRLTAREHEVGCGRITFVSLLFASLSISIDFFGLYSHDRTINEYHFSFYYAQHLNDPASVLVDGFQEPGWAAFNIFFRLMTDNYGAALFTVAFVYVFTSLLLLKSLRIGSFRSAASVFLVTMGPLYALSQSSQFLAIAICNIGVICLVSCNRKRMGIPLFAAFSMIAATVHTSAVILPLLVILGSLVVVSKTRAAWFLVIGFLAAMTATSLLPLVASYFPFLQQTMDASFSGGSQGYFVALKSVPFFLIALAMLRKEQEKGFKGGISGQVSWFLVACSGMAYVAATGNYWFWRIAMYGLVPFAALASYDREASKHSLLQLGAVVIQIVISLREAAILYPLSQGVI